MNDDQKKKKVVQLSWWILEQKLFYYNPQYGECVDDTLYDKKELEYIGYCKDLGITPTASDNVGFPWDTPSGRLVASKFMKNDKRPKTDFHECERATIILNFEMEMEEGFAEIERRKNKRKRPIN